MKCSIVGRLDGTGKCNNEATQTNSCGHPVCDQCAEDSNFLVKQLNFLAVVLGEKPRYKPTIPKSDN